jgi:hypothetical protein
MSDCTHMKDGKCSLGLFGGSPTRMSCASCMSYSGNIRGLGDIVAKVAQVTGIATVAKRSGCNCGARRKKLNEILDLGS